MADPIIEDQLYLGDMDDALCKGEYCRTINVLGWIEPDTVTGYVDKKALDALAYLIHKSIENYDVVLVHCRAGMERSPLVVVWYLYNYRTNIFPTIQEAYKYVQNIRPCVQNRESWIEYKRRK